MWRKEIKQMPSAYPLLNEPVQNIIIYSSWNVLWLHFSNVIFHKVEPELEVEQDALSILRQNAFHQTIKNAR